MTKSCDTRGGETESIIDRQTAALIFVLLLALYLLLASLRIDSGDGEAVYQVTRSLVEGRGFAISPPPPGALVRDPFGEPIPEEQLNGGGPYGAWGVDGRYYAQYGVGQSLLALPLYLLGHGVHRLTVWGTEDLVTRAGVSLLNPLVLALAGAVLYQVARRLGYGQRASIGVALAVGLATPLWVYGKTFFSEPLVALLLALALLAALWGEEGSPGGWTVCGGALGLAVLVKPVMLAVTPVFLVFAFSRRRQRWRSLLWTVWPLLLGLAAAGVYNAARFGSPLDTGYRTAAWDTPLWVGLAGLLVSPGKGLLWYCPALVLGMAGFIPLARRKPRAAALLGAVSVLHFVVHALYNHWHGSGAWGPRLVMPVIPLLLLPAGEWLQRPPRQTWMRLLLAALLALGMILQLPAVLVNPGRALQALYVRSASPAQYTMRLLYRPADSPLLAQWRSLLEVAVLTRSAEGRAALREMAAAAEENEEAGWDRLTEAAGLLAYNTFDLWPVTWALLGAPRAPLLLVEGGWMGLALWAAYRLRRVAV